MSNGGQLVVTSQFLNGIILVRVQDTGNGLPPGIKDLLFEEPAPSKDLGGGAGLGLWLSRLILQSMGGNIRVGGSDNSGTIMLVEISTLDAKEGPGNETQDPDY